MSDHDNTKTPGIGSPQPEKNANEIAQLIQLLRNGLTVSERIHAAEKLGYPGNAQAVSALLGRLTNDRDDDVRIAAAVALYNIGDPQVWSVIAQRLSDSETTSRDPSSKVRARLAELLGLHGDRAYARSLVSALRDEPDNRRDLTPVQENAIISLGQLKEQSIIPVLVDGLGVQDSKRYSSSTQFNSISITNAHIKALIKIGVMVAEQVLLSAGAFKDKPEDCNEYSHREKVLVGIGVEVIPVVSKVLTSQPALSVEIVGTKVLSQLLDEKATQNLCHIVTNNKTAQVRRLAIEGLSKRPPQDVTKTLVHVLQNDSDPALRELSAKVLADVKAILAVQSLCVSAVRDNGINVRRQAISSLGFLEQPEAINTLSDILLDCQDETSRLRAAESLGKIKMPESIGSLVSAANSDVSSSVRSMAFTALSQLESQQARDAVLKLYSNLTADSRFVYERRAIIEKSTQIPLLVYAINHEQDTNNREKILESLSRTRRPEAIDTILVALKNDREDRVRSNAARLLGSFKENRVIDALITSLRDKASYVRSSAAEGLGEIGDQRALPALRSAAKDSEIQYTVNEAIRKITKK